uniref:Uncharacterized protein n=1 Tax=Ananas comosus var. bracteatus TaxID=296719 RepID=A0A6V7PL44_ANACO|nr:unnamed protein product [Ananas comosus var. bracteatus]
MAATAAAAELRDGGGEFLEAVGMLQVRPRAAALQGRRRELGSDRACPRNPSGGCSAAVALGTARGGSDRPPEVGGGCHGVAQGGGGTGKRSHPDLGPNRSGRDASWPKQRRRPVGAPATGRGGRQGSGDGGRSGFRWWLRAGKPRVNLGLGSAQAAAGCSSGCGSALGGGGRPVLVAGAPGEAPERRATSGLPQTRDKEEEREREREREEGGRWWLRRWLPAMARSAAAGRGAAHEEKGWGDRQSRRRSPLGTMEDSSHPTLFPVVGTGLPREDRGKGIVPNQ